MDPDGSYYYDDTYEEIISEESNKNSSSLSSDCHSVKSSRKNARRKLTEKAKKKKKPKGETVHTSPTIEGMRKDQPINETKQKRLHRNPHPRFYEDELPISVLSDSTDS